MAGSSHCLVAVLVLEQQSVQQAAAPVDLLAMETNTDDIDEIQVPLPL